MWSNAYDFVLGGHGVWKRSAFNTITLAARCHISRQSQSRVLQSPSRRQYRAKQNSAHLSSPPSHKLRHSFLPHVKEPWPFKSPSHSAIKCPLPHNARNSPYIAWSLLATTGTSPVFLFVFLRHLKRRYSHDRVKTGYLEHFSFLWGAI